MREGPVTIEAEVSSPGPAPEHIPALSPDEKRAVEYPGREARASMNVRGRSVEQETISSGEADIERRPERESGIQHERPAHQDERPASASPVERKAIERGIATRTSPGAPQEPSFAKKVISRAAGILFGGTAGLLLPIFATNLLDGMVKYGWSQVFSYSKFILTQPGWGAAMLSAMYTAAGPIGIAAGAVAGYFLARRLISGGKKKS